MSVWIDAAPQRPLAVKVVPLPEHATRSRRAWVTQARPPVAGHARRPQGVFARGVLAGTARWWRDPHGILCVVPAQAARAVPADARALAAAGAGRPGGRRVHPIRPGQGREAWSARRETAGVGRAGLTPDAHSGTPEPARQHPRRHCSPHPIPAVVVRPWQGRDFGPGGHPVFWTHAAGEQPWPPVDDADDRRRSEPGCLTAAQPPGDLKPPPPPTGRAVRGPVGCPRLLFAGATASRRRRAPPDPGTDPVGWPRWRRQLRPQNRDPVIVLAPGCSGIFPMAACALLLGVKRTDVPPGIGTPQEVLAT